MSNALGAPESLFINQAQCLMLGHAAESVFGALAVEASNTLKVGFSGRFPSDRDLKNIVLAAGVPRSLGLDLPRPADFLSFELRSGQRTKELPYRSTHREIATDLLTRYVDRCLNEYGHELSDVGKATLAGLVGEVLTNAEEHSLRSKWWIAGYMQKKEEGYGDCHITIFSFGETFAGSLQRLPEDSVLRRDLDRLTQEHSRRRLFIQDWTPENLWTLYALQEGVSRHNTGKQAVGNRGIGTADMIEFFQELGQAHGHEPRMCLVSGHTQIIFDRRYLIHRQLSRLKEQRRIIAFNDNNDLATPPDRRNVRTLKRFFPGSVISLRFFLDEEHLKGSEKRWHR